MATTRSATARIPVQKQRLDELYSPPTNLLEVDVDDQQTHGVGKNRYTDYDVKLTVNYQSGSCLFWGILLFVSI